MVFWSKWRVIVLVGIVSLAAGVKCAIAEWSPTTRPADAARFIGTWKATVATGTIPESLVWDNRTDGFTTTAPGPSGPVVVGSGVFEAQQGLWETFCPLGVSDEGVYHFMDDNHVVVEGEAGVIIVWTRQVQSSKVS
jgi:hypothetical protein